MRGYFVMLLLASCANHTGDSSWLRPDVTPAHEPDADAPATHARGECAAKVALYGMTGNAGATPVGPLTVDAAGLDICMSLDARDNLLVAHFSAVADFETAASSSVTLALYDANGALMRSGWDVSFGSSPTTTFTNLEYGIEKGKLVDATLWVRAKTGIATSMIQLSLFEPYE